MLLMGARISSVESIRTIMDDYIDTIIEHHKSPDILAKRNAWLTLGACDSPYIRALFCKCRCYMCGKNMFEYQGRFICVAHEEIEDHLLPMARPNILHIWCNGCVDIIVEDLQATCKKILDLLIFMRMLFGYDISIHALEIILGIYGRDIGQQESTTSIKATYDLVVERNDGRLCREVDKPEIECADGYEYQYYNNHINRARIYFLPIK